MATISNPTLLFGGALEAPEGVEEELVGSALQEETQAVLEGLMATPRRAQALPGLGRGCIRGLALQEAPLFPWMLCCWPWQPQNWIPVLQDPSWVRLWAMPEPRSLHWDAASLVFAVTKPQNTLCPGPAQPQFSDAEGEASPEKGRRRAPRSYPAKPHRGHPSGAPVPAGC